MVYLNFFLQFAQLVQCILCSAVRAGYFASWTEVSKDKDWVTEVVVKDREGTDVSVKGDRAGVDGLGIMITEKELLFLDIVFFFFCQHSYPLLY